MNRLLMGLGLAIMGSSVAIAAPEASEADARVTVETIEYRTDPALPDIGIATVAGNPASGAYTLRAKFATGARTPAHFHPDERTITVLSGTYYFGVGYRFDEARLRACPPGSVIVVPAELRHFSWAKDGEVVLQESGLGPTGLTPTGH